MGIQVWACMGSGNWEDELLCLYSTRTRLKQLCFELKGGLTETPLYSANSDDKEQTISDFCSLEKSFLLNNLMFCRK